MATKQHKQSTTRKNSTRTKPAKATKSAKQARAAVVASKESEPAGEVKNQPLTEAEATVCVIQFFEPDGSRVLGTVFMNELEAERYVGRFSWGMTADGYTKARVVLKVNLLAQLAAASEQTSNELRQKDGRWEPLYEMGEKMRRVYTGL